MIRLLATSITPATPHCVSIQTLGDCLTVRVGPAHKTGMRNRLRCAVGRMGSGANARVAGDDEEMQRFVPIEDLFKGRHFDRQIIVLCVSWYTSFKLSLRDLVIMMARPRHFRDAYNDSPVGPALPAGVREALAAATLDPSADRGGWTRPIVR